MRLQRLTLAVMLMASGSIPANAQEEDTAQSVTEWSIESGWSFELGAGAGIGPDYEGSDDYEVSAVPIVDVSWNNRVLVTTKGRLGIYATPYQANNLTVDLGVFYDGGRDEDDNEALKGLGDLDVGAVAMGRLGYDFGLVEAGLEVTQDLTGDRDGMTVTAELEYGRTFFDDQVHFGVTPYVTWANGDYMDNSFGISAAQSGSSARGFAQHDAGSGLKDAGVSIDLGYRITENISAFGGVQYSRLLGDAADSPLVADEGSENQLGAFLGLSYRW